MMAQKERGLLDDDDPSESAEFTTIDNFLNNLRGVLTYSTPCFGSELANIAYRIGGTSDVLMFLRTLNIKAARLNEDFRRWRRKHKKLRVSAMVEGEPLRGYWTRLISEQISAFWPLTYLPHSLERALWGNEFELQVVHEASARYDCDEFKTAARDNHISICKPQTTTCQSFHFLLTFVEETVPELMVGRLALT